MSSVLLVMHLLITLALIAVILLQKSEGGAFGIGGEGGGAGGMAGLISGRSAANIMTRTTSILALCFILSSLGLTLIADRVDHPSSITDDLAVPQQQEGAGGATGANALDDVFSPPVSE